MPLYMTYNVRRERYCITSVHVGITIHNTPCAELGKERPKQATEVDSIPLLMRNRVPGFDRTNDGKWLSRVEYFAFFKKQFLHAGCGGVC